MAGIIVDPEKVSRLYTGGLSTSAIAERFGVGSGVIRRMLKSKGVKLDGRHTYAGQGNHMAWPSITRKG